MVAQVGISGSVNIGRNCVFAGHSGVVDHVTIGDDVKVMMKTGVSKDVPAENSVSGQPAMDHREAYANRGHHAPTAGDLRRVEEDEEKR